MTRYRNLNWNSLARYIIDHCIDLRLFQYLSDLTKNDWPYYRVIITERWLNSENKQDGISQVGVLNKITNAKRKIQEENRTENEINKYSKRIKKAKKLAVGDYELEDLSNFFDFTDPVGILIILAKYDIKGRIKVVKREKVTQAISRIYDKRSDQYHPVSSGIIRNSPFTEGDIRVILEHGRTIFDCLGLRSDAQTFANYAENLPELIIEWENHEGLSEESDVFDNLPLREYENWGFFGYKVELDTLIEKLTNGNQRFFQIIGQGGSGKSALANELCHIIINKENPRLKFNMFIWVTSKSDYLSTKGVEVDGGANNYSSYDDFIRQIFLGYNLASYEETQDFHEFSNEEIENELKELIGERDTIKKLVIIDNFENILPDNQRKITEFLDKYVSKPTYVIITSRHRIIDNFPSTNIEITGLDKTSAEKLFFKLMEYNEIDFRCRSEQDRHRVRDYLETASYYPLAIKYCIEKAKNESISIEKSFSVCRQGSSDLHKFIFHDTYSKLDPYPKKLLKLIALYKSEWDEDIDRNILRMMYNSIYNDTHFSTSLDILHEHTLISYLGISNDDIMVVLSDLIISHINHIIESTPGYDKEMIIRKMDQYRTNHFVASATPHKPSYTTTAIVGHIFTECLKKVESVFNYKDAIDKIEEYSSEFYGMPYLRAKLLQLELSGSKTTNKRKTILDYYESALRLEPIPLIYIDYFTFIKKFYPTTIRHKLSKKLPQLYSLYYNTTTIENKRSYARIVVDVLVSTKEYKNQESITFYEDLLNQAFTINHLTTDLKMLVHFANEWMKSSNKSIQLTKLLDITTIATNDDNKKDLIITNNLTLFHKIKDYLENGS